MKNSKQTFSPGFPSNTPNPGTSNSNVHGSFYSAPGSARSLTLSTWKKDKQIIPPNPSISNPRRSMT